MPQHALKSGFQVYASIVMDLLWLNRNKIVLTYKNKINKIVHDSHSLDIGTLLKQIKLTVKSHLEIIGILLLH